MNRATLLRSFLQPTPSRSLSTSPLAGIRVVDLSRILAAPFATQNLADLGADVIKVERVGMGDDTRTWGPPFVQPSLSAYFLSCNRGKRSIALDYTTPAGREIVTRLVERADVLVENCKPGTLARHGLDYPTLRQVNPALVYASLTGYGQTGPDKSAYDLTIAAEGGLMGITGPEGGEPVKVGVAITDICAGLYLLSAVTAALYRRERDGAGEHLDISMFNCQLATLVNVASNYLNAGLVAEPRGSSHASIVPYQGFSTADGFIVVAANNDNQFWELAEAVGWPWLASNPMFSTNELRVENREALLGHLTERFAEETTEYWVGVAEGYSFSVSPVNNVEEAFEHPAAAGMVHQVRDGDGDVRVVGHPVRWGGEDPVREYGGAPLLGQNTGEVLRELGYSEGEVEKLVREGVVQ